MISPSTPSTHAHNDTVASESPTDRVEKLLKKYKSQKAAASNRHKETDEPNNLYSKELDLWNVLNDELQAEGFKTVLFTRPTASQDAGCIMLSLSSSVALRDTIHCLLEEKKQKKSVLQDLPSSSTPHTPRVSFQLPESPSNEDTSSTQSSGSITQHLQSQLAKLKYENARLKVDLQNRPELHEMHRYHKVAQELEKEFEETKSLLSLEQEDLLQSQKHVKQACSLLQVSTSEEMLPRLCEMVDGRKQLEKWLTSVVSIVSPTSSGKKRTSSSRTSDITTRHDIWCGITWDQVILTLQEWKEHLRGLKELEEAVSDVYLHLELSSCKDGERETFDVSDSDGGLTCMEMAKLLRNWLVGKGHLKHASSKLLMEMVRHFQHLFGVSKLSGVYPAMSRVYQQLEESKNIIKHLKCSLHLDKDSSNHQLMSTVEYLAAGKNGELLMAIHKDFGSMDTWEVVEKLHLCKEFFPAFQTVTTQLLDMLGVESLGGIVPAVQDLLGL